MKHCPICKRATRPKYTSVTEYPGTICMIRNDGLCMNCWKKESEQRYSPEIDARTKENKRTLEEYLNRRRGRRVPADGFQDAEGVPA